MTQISLQLETTETEERSDLMDRIRDEVRRAYRRDTGSTRHASLWSINSVGYSDHTTYYEATIVGAKTRDGYPILGTARVTVSS